MMPESVDQIGLDVFNPPLPNYGVEFDPLEDLLSNDTFGFDQNKWLGEQSDRTEFFQPCEDLLPEWETQRLFPELCGIKHQADRDTRVFYYEYEVRRSEVTRCISVGGGEEVSVVHTVQQNVLSWQEAAMECSCPFQEGEPLSNHDKSVATCGIFQRQQVPPLHPVSGYPGHRLGDRPVGAPAEIVDGKCGDPKEIDCELKTSCVTNVGDVNDLFASRLTDCEAQLFHRLLQILSDNTSQREADGAVSKDQSPTESLMQQYSEWKRDNLTKHQPDIKSKS